MTIDYGMLINGQWIKKIPEKNVAIKSPYSGKTIAFVPVAEPEEIEEAVANAKSTFDNTRLTPTERFNILSKASYLLSQRKEEVALTLCQESGKPIKDARIEVERAVQTFLISAEEAKRIHGEQIPVESAKGSENRIAFTMRFPVGVVCAISPFNFPLNLVAHKIAPAIAAGNTVVLKPAYVTPLSAINLAKILMEAGLPPGFLNIVFGPGNTVGELLLQDQRFSLYTFTGSPVIGKRIREVVGLRKTILELGSNAAVIINKDADLDKAVKSCTRAAYTYSGQICISLQRIYVHKTIAADFIERFQNAVKNLKIGDPLDNNTDVGPMINEAEARRAESWINEAVAQGANLICGGKREGSLLYPTIITNPHPKMKVVCCEVFAPVVTINEFSDLNDAINLVNDSDFGLQAGIFTQDLTAAFQAAQKIQVGGLLINDAPMYRADQMPYGGVKNSGVGREGPKYTIEEMTDTKIIILNL